MAGKWHVPYAVIFLTNNCNLACSYCFANRTGQLSMSRRTAERSVEWLFENTEGFPENALILSFFGGEPLLEFGLLKAVVEHAGSLSQKYGKSMIFSLTTNGTLLTDEMLDFMEKHKISMLFSIDGDRQTNDRFRLKKNGTSPFDTLCTNARKVLQRFPNTAAWMTITPEIAGSVYDNIIFLERLGFSFISSFVALELFTDHNDWKTFDAECRRIAGYIIEKASEGKFLHLHFPDNGIQQIVENQAINVACGAGKTFVGIDAEGEIYPCHRFVTYAGAEKEKFRLGNVFTGIDPVRTLPFRRYDKTHILGCYTRCNECPAKDFCAGGCIALHQEINSLFTMPLLQQQKLMTIWHCICNETIEAFKEMDRYDFLLEQIRMKPQSFVPVND